MQRWLLNISPILGFSVACVRVGGFSCDTNEQCNLNGQPGICQPEGYCSYSDASCPSGQRFEDHAEKGLAGTCVDPSVADSGSTDESTGTDTVSESDSSGSGEESTETGMDDGCGAAGEPCCANDQCDADLWCAGTACGCATALSLGVRHSCAIKVDGSVWCWGRNVQSELGLVADEPSFSADPVEVPAAFHPDAMAVGLATDNHSCGLREDGIALCWGRDDYGQVDLMLGSDPKMPEGVAFADSLTILGVGATHTCGQVEGVGLRCWGRNQAFQLGSMAADPGPVDVVGLGEATALTLGGAFTCALGTGDQVSCWGANDSGQLSRDPNLQGPTPTPQLVALGGTATQLVGGRDHACALVGGLVKCWGRNDLGQLGDGTGVAQFEPQLIADAELSGPVATIASGTHHALLVTDDGDLFGWGSNADGQLMLEPDGMGNDQWTLAPVLIEEIDEVVTVSSGHTHTCAITRDGGVWCWGTNSEGQLGDGTQAFGFEPTRVGLSCL